MMPEPGTIEMSVAAPVEGPMALSALLIHLCGLILVFGIRALVAWVRTGDTGFRRPDTTAFSAAWWATVLFIAALLAGIAAPAAALAGLPTASFAPDHPALGWGGVAVMAVGLVLVLASQAAMGSSWRIGVDPAERSGLVTSGVFALVRNPVFTAMGVLLTGLAAAVPTPVSVAALVVFTAAVQIQVRVIEEPYLLHAHPGTYTDYAARTGRFLPGLGRRNTAAGNDR